NQQVSGVPSRGDRLLVGLATARGSLRPFLIVVPFRSAQPTMGCEERQILGERAARVRDPVFRGEDCFSFRTVVIALPFVTWAQSVHVSQSEVCGLWAVGDCCQPTLIPDLGVIHHFEFG